MVIYKGFSVTDPKNIVFRMGRITPQSDAKINCIIIAVVDALALG
jgi:hypothetical protein